MTTIKSFIDSLALLAQAALKRAETGLVWANDRRWSEGYVKGFDDGYAQGVLAKESNNAELSPTSEHDV